MFDSEYNDAFDSDDPDHRSDDEFVYEMDAESSYDQYEEHDDYYVVGYDRVIYPDDLEAEQEGQFWTRRRIFLVIIVILMIGALLFPMAYNAYRATNQPDGPARYGPTPTALPSI